MVATGAVKAEQSITTKFMIADRFHSPRPLNSELWYFCLKILNKQSRSSCDDIVILINLFIHGGMSTEYSLIVEAAISLNYN